MATSSGVNYQISPGDFLNTYNVFISAPDGQVIYNGVDISSGNILQLNSPHSVNIPAYTFNQSFFVTPDIQDGIFTISDPSSSTDDFDQNIFYISGTVTINVLTSGFTNSQIHILGGNLTLTETGNILTNAGNNTFEITYGGRFFIGNQIANLLTQSTVTFGAGGGTFAFSNGSNLSGIAIQNYDPKLDVIELENTSEHLQSYTISSGSGGSSTRNITLTYTSGNIFTFTVNLADGVDLPPGTYDASSPNNPLSISYNNGNIDIGACFLAGSMIRTPQGDIAIENIQVGDEIISYVDGKEEIRQVTWIGRQRTNIQINCPDDEAGYPIRILKDAIADGVPYKDMLITAEHCLFLNKKFVPARMLVNNLSIFYDHSISSYIYYHIETEKHSIISADGMLTESYLDTGNRISFQKKSITPPKNDRHLRWENDACAPLDVSRKFVEPLFYSILSRNYNDLQEMNNDFLSETTTENNLHLLTNAGNILYPAHIQDSFYQFLLPMSTTSVQIISHATRPSDIIGPFIDDRRHLGVLIGKIIFQNEHSTKEIKLHTEAQHLNGWYQKERLPYRWTNGIASLPLDQFTMTKYNCLVIQILCSGPYLKKNNNKTNYPNPAHTTIRLSVSHEYSA